MTVIHGFACCVLLFLIGLSTTASSQQLHWDKLEPVRVSNYTLRLNAPRSVPSDTAFVQVRAFVYSPDASVYLELSTSIGFGYRTTASGQAVGLASLNPQFTLWYLRAVGLAEDDNANSSITAWLLFSAKSWHEPLPGGCYDNSTIDYSPVVEQVRHAVTTTLHFSAANYFTDRRIRPNCNSTAASQPIQYRLYAYQLASFAHKDWLIALRRMATANGAITYGRQLAEIDNGDDSDDNDDDNNNNAIIKPNTTDELKFNLANRRALPIIYTIVVERTDTQAYTAYVPVVLCECSDSLPALHCSAAAGIGWRIVTIAAALIGLFLCCAGYRYYSASVIIITLAIIFFTTSALIARTRAGWPAWLNYLISSAVALTLVVIGYCLARKLKVKNKALAYAIIHSLAGYCLCCLIFATPFRRLWWLTMANYAFYVAFGIILLLIVLTMMFFSKRGVLVSLSLIGAFTIECCIASNLLVGSSVPYIFIDFYRRSAYYEYDTAIMPLWFKNTKDMILLALLAPIIIISYILQRCCNRRQFIGEQRMNWRITNSDGTRAGYAQIFNHDEHHDQHRNRAPNYYGSLINEENDWPPTRAAAATAAAAGPNTTSTSARRSGVNERSSLLAV